MLTARVADSADVSLIKELALQVWPQTYRKVLAEEQVSYMMDMMYAAESLLQQMNSGHVFVLCFDGDEPLGYASYEGAGNGVFKLHKLYVILTAQGRGAGAYLVRYIINELKMQNARELRLNVNRYNYNAQAFYNKQGFVKADEEDIDIGNGYFMNDYVLALAL